MAPEFFQEAPATAPPFSMALPSEGPAKRPIAAIVRVAVVTVTLALFFSSLFNAVLGFRDIAIILALATPLGLSAWGFSRAGQHEAAIVLLCCVLVVVVTLILVMNPLGVHDMAITAYGGVVLVGALLLSRRAFFAIVFLTIVAASLAFWAELLGFGRSRFSGLGGWPQYVDFLVITAVFAIIGRYASEHLLGTLGDAHDATSIDGVTSLLNRRAFLMSASMRLRLAQERGEFAMLLVVDIDGFRRINLVIGQQAADNVLAEVGRRVSLLDRDNQYLVGRTGDDEISILAAGVPEDGIAALARSFHAVTNFDYLGVSVRSAAGYARFPRDAHGIEPLMLAAQSGVGHAKADPDERLSGPADRI